MDVLASNRMLVLGALWFLGLGGVSLAYLLDARGWLTRIVNLRVDQAQAVAFDMRLSAAERRMATLLADKRRVRRQQRIAAGCCLAMSAAIVMSCLASLWLRD